MEQSTFHCWTCEQDITIFHWMNHQYLKPAFTSPFGKYEYIKVPFGLMQAPAYFQELMTAFLKDFSFTIAYLNNIIIFSRIAEEHLSHINEVFGKLRNTHISMKLPNVISSQRKSSTSDTFLAPKASDPYHQKPKQ